MKIILNLLIRVLAVIITTYLVPGVNLEGWMAAIVTVVVLGLLNILVKPFVVLLTLPINIVTLGLFTFVINTAIVLLASRLVPGFSISSFWSGLLFSVVLSLVNFFLNFLKK